MNRIIYSTSLGLVGFLSVSCETPLIAPASRDATLRGGATATPCSDSLTVPPGPLNSPTKKYVNKDLLPPSGRGEWPNWMAAGGNDPAPYIKNVALDDGSLPYGGAGESVRINFHLSQRDWAGVAVASYPNCWGEWCCPAFYDLGGARRLIFYARGGHGGEVIEVKVAILGDKPYGDSASKPATTGSVTLSREWRRYALNLAHIDLSRVVTPFSVFAAGSHNQRNVEICLDEIYFEL